MSTTTTPTTAAEATADNAAIMTRLSVLRPTAAAASAATIRLSALAEEEMTKFHGKEKNYNRALTLNAYLDVTREYGIASAAGNEANEMVARVAKVYDVSSKAIDAYNAAATEANAAMADAVDKRAVASGMVEECGDLLQTATEFGGTTLINTKSAEEVKRLRDTEAAVAVANAATVRVTTAMKLADEAEADKDKWKGIIGCYDLDAIEALATAIQNDARAASVTQAVARFKPAE